MPLPPPPAIVRQATIAIAPETPRLQELELGLLADLDAGNALERPARIAPADRAAFDWLWSAAQWAPGRKAPANPFKAGAAAREAALWRAALAQPKADPSGLPLSLSGSRLLLWAWMRGRDREAPLPKRARERIEDRLLDGGPPMIQGWALRHALCFTVAADDTARFAALKAKYGDAAPDTFASIQSLLGLIGGPSPTFRLWRLQGLDYQDLTLAGLKASRVWVCPPGPPVPEGAAWILPSSAGQQNGREALLSPELKAEAESLAAAVDRCPAWFAASKTEWEAAGLQWFPILIDLDTHGNLKRVRMGDAAP